MNGWHIRHDLGGDVPFFAGLILATGAVVGAVVAFVVDWTLHRHRSGRA